MKLSTSNWLLVLFVFCTLCNVGLSENKGLGNSKDDVTKFITWDDLKLNGLSNVSGVTDRDGNNGSRVIIVDQNGKGDVRTVQEAVDMVPDDNNQRIKIHILPGIYREKVNVDKSKAYISFIGDEEHPENTVIVWGDKAGDSDTKGGELGTRRSASVTVESDYFCASGVTFMNTVVQKPNVKGNQAVAFLISGDRAFFYKVRFIGSQDTLWDDAGLHYFYQCFIYGVTDFIFGQATSIYQECNITVPQHGYAIAAHGRKLADEDTGFSFVNCTVTGPRTRRTSVFLGRSWGDHSRIIYSFCKLDIRVKPGRWNFMGHESRKETVVFGEYNDTGRGATKNCKWPEPLDDTQARVFFDRSFIKADDWLRL